MRINTNVAALNSYNQLNNTNNKLSKSLERLSSGKRINGAADDAAGLAISEKMGSQTRGLAQAQRNAQDAISMNQTAEGALKESHSILQRMRELSVQSANDTNTDADRAEIQEEVNQLSKELSRISETTEFNTQKLLDGSLENMFQIGANEGQNMEMGINDMSAQALEVGEDAVKMGSSTDGVESVEVDGDLNVDNFELTATGVEADIEDTKMSYATGVSTSGNGISFVDDNITVDSSGGGDFDWTSIASGTNTVTVAKTSGGLKVEIDATDGTGNTLDITDEYATFNESTGNYEYDSHGVSFSVTEDEFNSLEDGSDSLTIDMDDYNVADMTSATANSGVLGTDSTYEQSGSSNTFATFSDIEYDENSLPEDAYSVKVNASGLTSGGSGTFAVELYNEDGDQLVSDSITYSGGLGDDFSYDDHGVKFTIGNLSGATDSGLTNIDFNGSDAGSGTAIDYVEEGVEFSLENTETGEVSTEKINSGAATEVSFTDVTDADGETGDFTFGIDAFENLDAITDASTEYSASELENTVQGIDVTSQEAADSAISTIDDAIANVSSERSKLGAVQNRLEHTINNLNTAEENLTAAESRISDVDMAREMMNMSKQQILSQAGTAMMAQANQLPQGVLQLLG